MDVDSTSFDTKLMLPDLWIEHDKPSVYYFAPFTSVSIPLATECFNVRWKARPR